MSIGCLLSRHLIINAIIAPAWFWPGGKNPRRHPSVPWVYINKQSQKSKKSENCVCSMRCVPDLTKLGAHGGLG